jgi:hypothetical protein
MINRVADRGLGSNPLEEWLAREEAAWLEEQRRWCPAPWMLAASLVISLLFWALFWALLWTVLWICGL